MFFPLGDSAVELTRGIKRRLLFVNLFVINLLNEVDF